MRKSVIILLLLLLPLCLEARRIYVLAAGVSDYPGTESDLRLPCNDARAICYLYRNNSDAEVILLTNENATKENILRKARSLFSQAGSNDIVVLFFSGHGFPGGFVVYDKGYITYREMYSVFANCPAKNKMIFADACYSGKMNSLGKGGHSKDKKGVMFFLSSRDNETSRERSDMENGFFTACLLSSLKGGADANGDRIITARELFVKVKQGVMRLSAGAQHPVMWGSFNDNMVVMSWKHS